VPAAQALSALREQGVETFAFTDIDHDGMLDGPDPATVERAARAVGSGHLIMSGGIGTLEHLEQLARMRDDLGLSGLDGVIVGKALYEGRFTVQEALAALGG
jgi:phosphoribosylformimino-5-aminoimidazole carboxamide ribonucleotide (ProFAR) isomerase